MATWRRGALLAVMVAVTIVWLVVGVMMVVKLREATAQLPPTSLAGAAKAVLSTDDSGAIMVASATSPSFKVWVARADTIISATIAEKGVWEPELTALASAILSQACGPDADGVVVDVGAFLGWFSLLAASFGCGAHAFEPQDRAVKLLRQSIISNNFKGIQVHQTLVWDTHEPLELGTGINNWGATRVRGVAPKGIVSSVPARVDDLVMPTERIPLMKVDVESREWHVLESAAALFDAHAVENVVMEFNPALLRPSEHLAPLKFLADRGFVLRQVGPDFEGEGHMSVIDPATFSRYAMRLARCGADCYTNIWAVAPGVGLATAGSSQAAPSKSSTPARAALVEQPRRDVGSALRGHT